MNGAVKLNNLSNGDEDVSDDVVPNGPILETEDAVCWEKEVEEENEVTAYSDTSPKDYLIVRNRPLTADEIILLLDEKLQVRGTDIFSHHILIGISSPLPYA